jgi:hypothetical protein
VRSDFINTRRRPERKFKSPATNEDQNMGAKTGTFAVKLSALLHDRLSRQIVRSNCKNRSESKVYSKTTNMARRLQIDKYPKIKLEKQN